MTAARKPMSREDIAKAGAQAHWARKGGKKGMPMPDLPPSEVAIIGPLVGVGVPESGECKWVEGHADTGQWCGQPAPGATYCGYHADRVKAWDMRPRR